MEHKMETSMVYWGCIRVLENKMETRLQRELSVFFLVVRLRGA